MRLLLELLLLAALLFDCQHTLLLADGCQEGFEVVVEIFRVDLEVPVEEEEELLFHEVHFGDGEAEVGKAPDDGVPRPVLVLRGAVIEVLCGEDESSQEDSVNSATHALCNRW